MVGASLGDLLTGGYPLKWGCFGSASRVANLSPIGENLRVINLITIAFFVIWVWGVESAISAESSPAVPNSTRLKIISVSADGKNYSWREGEEVRLPSFPENIALGYGAASKSNRVPPRLRYKLDGYDHEWHESVGQMFLAVRFLDEAGEQIARKIWNVTGESPGWQGELASATLNHRREMLVVPAGAARFQVSISSGGPAGTVGIYVVDGLVVSKISGAANNVVLRSPVGQRLPELSNGQVWPDWVRNGTRPSMAKIVEIGRNPATKALAIMDEDPFGHADWDSPKNSAPRVSPGEELLLEWNEVYSMGMATDWYAMYRKLPEGNYRFCVAELTTLGQPTGDQIALKVRVPMPFWRTAWFWGALALLLAAFSAATSRYLTWRRVRGRMLRLHQERMVEQERLRIAQNIHDDLGARITQISLLSGMSQNDPQLSEKARLAFDTISRMSRELVSALYETVWTVNPENDNLEALGSYLCQMADQLCQQAQLRCRLHLCDLPSEILVSSHKRHHVTLAVKEAVHNVIKHAQASEITLSVAWNGEELAISIQDNGRGFMVNGASTGHGLTNLKRRLAELAGICTIQSEVGRGATVEMRLPIGSPHREQASKNTVPAGDATKELTRCE
jgi:signal transduction histidine kinase